MSYAPDVGVMDGVLRNCGTITNLVAIAAEEIVHVVEGAVTPIEKLRNVALGIEDRC